MAPGPSVGFSGWTHHPTTMRDQDGPSPERPEMRCYTGQHRFYCGVDLHARTLYVHVLDHKGRTVFEQDLPADPKAFLTAIQPYRKDLVVGVECMFAWYWLADLCEAEKIPFALGHALYMKAIHGGKAKNDRIDAGKIARLLKGGTFPLAYVYRPVRHDLPGLATCDDSGAKFVCAKEEC